MLHPTHVKGHSLSLATAGMVLLWIALYLRADPNRHLGSFYANAIADWTGTLLMVLATKWLYEIGSRESRKPRPDRLPSALHFLRQHSLTIFLIATGAAWIAVYLRMQPDSRWGQVVGNLVSEWTQVLGLVLMTKYLTERNAKV